MAKTAFVTVGSTKFDDLVTAFSREDVISSLQSKGYTRLNIQCGHSYASDSGTYPQLQDVRVIETGGLRIEQFRFKPSLEEDFRSADLVISHAGSGTILEVLRMGKPLIVVPNSTLMDDHQTELAVKLDQLGYLKASTVSDIARAIADFNASEIVPFPGFTPERFSSLLNKEMGF
ncbi:glycosyl transferase [Punctularia strigosozonata HHB-11173 SS5]|uniref:glycosyl transferase n=1 Tax=Punctularia strigosozonata (strain HHB-11173) TaxID=741275 RepID=UPI0004416BD3|nr:glycosyl transferase [Punctularia strigosozonata HHB-11173 SS5]EIN07425.1 glycosyl transferase [Punctularia strigosozonata HHB-11173 SS5]